jgi:hypothetical protein
MKPQLALQNLFSQGKPMPAATPAPAPKKKKPAPKTPSILDKLQQVTKFPLAAGGQVSQRPTDSVNAPFGS